MYVQNMYGYSPHMVRMFILEMLNSRYYINIQIIMYFKSYQTRNIDLFKFILRREKLA